jgi:homoserine dehydrogenase
MVNLEDVYVEGIGSIEHVDIEIAGLLDSVIKPLVVFRNGKEGIDARVHPMIVPKTHKLAFVNENYNIIYIKGNFVGVTGFYGLGAGSVPTSSAVVGDTIDIAKALDSGAEIRQYGIPDLNSTAKVIPIERTANSYYVRLKTKDIENVSAEFTAHKIEIEKQMDVGGYTVFVTGTTVEREFKKLLKSLSSHRSISSPPSYLRFFNLEM